MCLWGSLEVTSLLTLWHHPHLCWAPSVTILQCIQPSDICRWSPNPDLVPPWPHFRYFPYPGYLSVSVRKSNLEREGFMSPSTYSPSLWEGRTGSQNRNLKTGTEQTPWRKATHWLVSSGLISYLSYTAQDTLSRGWHHPQKTEPSWIH